MENTPNYQPSLQDFIVEWDGQEIPVEVAIPRIQHGETPGTLLVYHPEYGTVTYGGYPNGYLVMRQGAPLNGTRFGVARTFGNKVIRRQDLLEDIDDVFENVSERVAVLLKAREKVLKLQLESAKKMMNRSQQDVPREVQNIVYQMIGEPEPVKGAYNVPNSLAKINTTLFTNEVNMPRHLKKINTTLFSNKKSRKARRKTRRNNKRKN